MTQAVDISVVIPVYNEAPNITLLAEEVFTALEPLGRTWELVLVDDGSDDESPRLLAELSAANSHLRAVTMSRNSGQSAALSAGIRAAHGDLLVMLDGDRQNDPADIPSLLALTDKADLVCGYRKNRHDSLVRRVSSRIANRVRNAVTHDGVRDTGCSLKACRRAALLRMPTFNGMHRFLPALFTIAGYTIVETPVNHRPRMAGVSKYDIGNRLWKGLSDLYVMAWMRRHWIFQLEEDVK